MRATVEAATDFQRQPDAETTAEKSGVTLKYEEMLAALEGLMAEMREETPQADASGKVVDQPSEERTTARPNIWVEAHAALSQK
ncbi:MAG: hypothetical protein WAU99_05275 [Pseudolabrys sp.]|jgi:hypothetical protein